MQTFLCDTGRTSKSLFLILGRSSVVEVPACLRDAMMFMFCLRANRFTCTGTSTTEDRPSIRNKLFDVLPVILFIEFVGVEIFSSYTHLQYDRLPVKVILDKSSRLNKILPTRF